MTPDAERILRDALSLPDDARMDLAGSRRFARAL
jgi:hypothetical protein